MKKIIKELTETVALTIIICAIFTLPLLASAKQDMTYTIASENCNGVHYEYVIDRVCTVTEIDGELITVETRNGNIYEFYGDGYKVNDTVICTFNSANEIINAE